MDPFKIVGQSASPATRQTDPVCGMSVDPATAKGKVEHGGKTYFICCPGCAAKFQADPQKYLRKVPAAPVAGMSLGASKPAATEGGRATYTGMVWVCPMDP